MKNKNFWDWPKSTGAKTYSKAESIILQALSGPKSISREDLLKSCRLRKQNFLNALKGLIEAGAIDRSGKGTKGSRYIYSASKTE